MGCFRELLVDKFETAVGFINDIDSEMVDLSSHFSVVEDKNQIIRKQRYVVGLLIRWRQGLIR